MKVVQKPPDEFLHQQKLPANWCKKGLCTSRPMFSPMKGLFLALVQKVVQIVFFLLFALVHGAVQIPPLFKREGGIICTRAPWTPYP